MISGTFFLSREKNAFIVEESVCSWRDMTVENIYPDNKVVKEDENDAKGKYDVEQHQVDFKVKDIKRKLSATFETIGIELQNVPDAIQEGTKKVNVILTEGPDIDPFGPTSLFWSLVSIVLTFVDYVSDIVVAVELHREDHDSTWWFGLTCVLIIVPAMTINMFSIFWFYQDHKKFRKANVGHRQVAHHARKPNRPERTTFSTLERWTLVVSHLFGFGTVMRSLQIIYCGVKEWYYARRAYKVYGQEYPNIEGPYCPAPPSKTKEKTDKDLVMENYRLRKYYERDSAYLGLIQGFIQDAPQILLQLYILASRHHAGDHEISRAGTVAISRIFCVSLL